MGLASLTEDTPLPFARAGDRRAHHDQAPARRARHTKPTRSSPAPRGAKPTFSVHDVRASRTIDSTVPRPPTFRRPSAVRGGSTTTAADRSDPQPARPLASFIG